MFNESTGPNLNHWLRPSPNLQFDKAAWMGRQSAPKICKGFPNENPHSMQQAIH